MSDPIFERSVQVPVSPAALYAWHARPGAFERLNPPWEDVAVVERDPGLADGAAVHLRVKAGGLPLSWHLVHRDHVPGEQFVDEQVRGPFARWRHTHQMRSAPAGATLVDHVDYALPLGALGQALAGRFVAAKLDALFRYRHRVMTDDLAQHARAAEGPLSVAVSGASGLLGSALQPFLTTGGHAVRRLVRGASDAPDAIRWRPDEGVIDAAALEGVDAVVHLAGESIAQRWTEARKRRILDSRVRGTATVARALAAMQRPPRVLVCASAVGFYGDTGDREVDETAERGRGFLADVCEAWEAAADPARDAGVRVVHLRFGVVLSPKGGALAKLLPIFKMGLGGPVGGGEQFFPWVALDDAVGAVHHALATPDLEGPVNVVGPEQVTSRDFAKTLGAVLHRPAVLPAPAFALKLAMGQMAEEALLGGQRVRPARLQATDYAFRHATLEDALRHTLGR